MKKLFLSFLILIPIICLGQNTINVPGDYSTIQEGIEAASDGDTVLVADGTYQEHIAWHNKTIVLASHFLTTGDTAHIESTIIDGTDNGRVFDIEYANPGSELRGFTIANGQVTQDWGGGIDVFQSDMLISDLVITNCSAVRGAGLCASHSFLALFNLNIENTEATERGAGIYMVNTGVYMNTCNITGSNAELGAGMYFYVNTPDPLFYWVVLHGCNFYENDAETQTAGLLIRNESPNTIVDVGLLGCSFTDNEGSANTAMQIRGENVFFNIMGCYFTDNLATDYTAGASFTNGCLGKVVNSIFCSNIANLSGGNWNSGAATVWGMGSEVEFTNCTFTGNSAAYGDAICVGPGSEAFLLNNIIWDNGNQPIALLGHDTTGSDGYLDYNDLQYGMDSILVDPQAELYWGDHNMSGDPLFESSGEDPWSITSGSPCIDTGTPDTTGMDLPPSDIIGNFRIWDGGSGTARVDLGAYEYGADVWVGMEKPEEIRSSSETEILIYPNPARDHMHILCEEAIVEVRIYDMQGRLIIKEDRAKTIEVSSLYSGLYFVEVLYSKGRDCRKLIIN
jgi:hypothetical protein